MTAVVLLPYGYGGDAPYRGELGGRVEAVYEFVVEVVARPGPCSPTGGFRGRGPTQVRITSRVAFRAVVRLNEETELYVAL